MDDQIRKMSAGILAIAGISLIGICLAMGSWGTNRPTSPVQIATSPSTSPSTQPLNKREQLFVRMKTPVVMPDDLLTTIKAKDPKLSAWVEAWNNDHLGTEQKDKTWLAPLMNQTSLSASDLWRLCRQIDRGGVSDACRYLAAASVRHAKSEMASGTAKVNASYINELSRLRVFLMLGVWTDPEALEIWANDILGAPARDRTPDIDDAARLGLAWTKFAREDYAGASKALDDLSSDPARKQKMSDTNLNELNYFLGNIAYQEGHYADALADYEAVPQVDSDDAIYAMEYSAFTLAHLGRLEDARHRLAKWIVRYHYNDQTFDDELAGNLAKIASGQDVPIF